MFVLLFPILFYIPKFFEVHSHYETKEVKSAIDCGKFLKLGQMLNNTRLRGRIIQTITEEELEKIEHFATACKIIIDEERDQVAQIQNSTAKNENIFSKVDDVPMKNDIRSMERDKETRLPMNSTTPPMISQTHQRRKMRYKRNNRGKQIKAKKLKKGCNVELPFCR